MNIFVGNLSFETSQQDLYTTFSQYGAVEKVNVITDRDTGQPRGFAFVEMSNLNEAKQAISELNGKELRGRALNVNEARPKSESGNRYSGGRTSGGGGRGRW
jgi:RNA recognition motif-containing protein